MEPEIYNVTWSSKLGCFFMAWKVITDGKLALEMPADNCCDMRGAIEMAEAIMPNVWLIATFSGGKADMEYRRTFEDNKWIAFDKRSNTK